MNKTTSYLELISGQRRGATANLLRAMLRTGAIVYRRLLGVRNWYHDHLRLPDLLPIPVISVGNITVGGTGKTPMTIWICRRLLERGLKPAVLSRGYKASREGLADELLMFSRQCPQAVAIAHPNRTAAGRLAIEKYDVDVAVLDDGFQHRRLGRDLDIVLIDATRPFGFGYILPRGLLRESLGGLGRADVIVLTRCDQCDDQQFDDIERTIRQFNAEAPILCSMHRAVSFADLQGNNVQIAENTRVGALAGIARPDAFEATLTTMNLAPAGSLWFDDHHVYTPADTETIKRWIQNNNINTVVTTDKDAVKLDALQANWPVNVIALHIEIEFVGQDDKILIGLIDELLEDYREYARANDEDTDTIDGTGTRVPNKQGMDDDHHV